MVGLGGRLNRLRPNAGKDVRETEGSGSTIERLAEKRKISVNAIDVILMQSDRRRIRYIHFKPRLVL